MVEEELDAIKVGIRNYIEHSQKPTAREPKYVVVIATKRHNKRFFFEMRNGKLLTYLYEIALIDFVECN